MTMNEEKKQAILERRVASRKLSEMIEQGIRYHEPVTVRAVDGKEYEVEVHAFSEDEFRELFEAAGADPRDIGNRDKLVQNMKFLGNVAAKATRDPAIGSVLLPNESAKIMMKCFEISGLTAAGPAARMEGFRREEP
jgi:hypothetical protein